MLLRINDFSIIIIIVMVIVISVTLSVTYVMRKYSHYSKYDICRCVSEYFLSLFYISGIFIFVPAAAIDDDTVYL